MRRDEVVRLVAELHAALAGRVTFLLLGGAPEAERNADLAARIAALDPTPRPPETTIPALVSSGRSDAATLSSTHSDRPGLSAALMVSTGALPPSAAASKVEVRIVTTLAASLDFTVWIALPA